MLIIKMQAREKKMFRQLKCPHVEFALLSFRSRVIYQNIAESRPIITTAFSALTLLVGPQKGHPTM